MHNYFVLCKHEGIFYFQCVANSIGDARDKAESLLNKYPDRLYVVVSLVDYCSMQATWKYQT